MPALISALVIALAADAVADPSLANEALTAVCASQKCRPPHTVTVEYENKPYQSQLPPLPYVVNDKIIVVVGDSFDVEVDWGTNGTPAHIALPGAVPRPEHNVHIEFSQTEYGLTLEINNSTQTKFKYDALMELPRMGLQPTSSCEVAPGIASRELWSDPIFKLVLSNLRPVAAGNTISCR
jgi:hypothetical protein